MVAVEDFLLIYKPSPPGYRDCKWRLGGSGRLKADLHPFTNGILMHCKKVAKIQQKKNNSRCGSLKKFNKPHVDTSNVETRVRCLHL